MREEELRLLHDIDMLILKGERPLDDTFSHIVTRTRDLLGGDYTSILMRRGRNLDTSYSTDPDVGQDVPIAGSLTGRALIESVPVNVGNVIDGPNRGSYVPISGYAGPQMRSLLAVPIILHDTAIGVMCTESVRENAFRPVHERMASGIAAQVAIALDRVQLFDRERLIASIDRLLFAEDDDYNSRRVFDRALQRVMEELQRLEHARLSGAQILFLRGQDELEIVYSTDPAEVGLLVTVSESICGRAVRERHTVVIGDVRSDPEYRVLGPNVRSEIVVPILVGNDDVVIGVLNVDSEELDAFTGFSELVLNSFASTVKTHLAFAKLRADVVEAMESRHIDDLLVLVGDQTSNMIHRINNTVGAMRVQIMELQRARKSGSLGEDELDQTLHNLLTNADRTLELPQRIVDLLGQDRSLADINDCVREAAARVEVPPTVQLDLQLSGGIPRVRLFAFDVVVQNLIQNAIDAMPDGGTLTVATTLMSPPSLAGGYIRLVVVDTGTGIPENLLTQIFKLNFTTKVDRAKGMGLGLWWVRHFIRRAQGEVDISSEVGAGTMVTIKIPVGVGGGTSDSGPGQGREGRQ